MKRFLWGLLLLSPSVLFGQAQKFPTVLPKSPDAAAMEQYVMSPVNLSTGTPNISIPLYEIKTNGFTLPVSLAYHPQIKVNQMASSVGLGWTLNGGGCITRSMKGKPDEDRDSLGIWRSNIATTPSSAVDVYNGYKDTEPDLFSFNFAGYSGQFVYSNGHFILDDQVLQIESDNNLLQFIITNADGIKFIFGSPTNAFISPYHERTIYKDYKYNLFEPLGSYEADGHNYLTYKTTTDIVDDIVVTSEGYISAWMLRAVIFPNSTDTIKFGYTPFTTMEVYTELSEDAFYPKNPSLPASVEYINRSFCINHISQKNLSSITWSNGSVIINYNFPRKDVASFETSGVPLSGGAYQLGYNATTSYAVSKVIIKDESNILRKGYEFDYDYYYNNAHIINESDPLKIRLRLKSLYEYSDAIKLPAYNFRYNSSYMPSIISANQDYWGFCNTDNYTSLNITERPHRIPLLKVDSSITVYDQLYSPTWYYTPVITSDPITATVGSYDRSMNTCAMCAVLKEISYPTGGKITYTYTLDTAYYYMNVNCVVRGGGFKISKIIQDDGKGNIITKSYTYPVAGRLMYVPHFAKRFLYHASSPPYPRGLTLYANSLTFPSGPAVLFDSVIEMQSGLGKTKYLYEIPYSTGDDPEGGDIGYYNPSEISSYAPGIFSHEILDYFPYSPYSTYDWVNGKLKSKTIYDNTNKIIQKEDYTYETNRTGLAYGYNVSLWNSEFYRDPGTSSTPEISGVFLINKYYYANGWKPIKQYKKRVYNSINTNYIETITDYEYSDATHLTSVTKETVSDGSKRITKSIYAGDFTPQTGDPVGDNGDYAYAINKMRTEKFMLNPVIETSSFYVPPSSSTEYLTLSALTLYKQFNSETQILPCKIFAVETAAPISGYTPVTIAEVSNDYTLSFHSAYKLQQEFVKYDDRANLLEIKDRNKGLASYIWGYDRSLPVAEFLNAHVNEHNSYIGDEGGHLNFESGNTESEVYENNYWVFEEVNPDTTDMYSGRFCGKINPGADRKIFRDFAPTRQNQVFKFSAWIKTPASYNLGRMVLAVDGYDYQYGESNQAAYVEFGDTDGKWKYVEVLFDLGKYRIDESISEETMITLKASIINYTSNKTLQVDDVRFAPVNSSVTTYTYDPVWGVPTSIMDASGTVVHYTYDKLGRLSSIRDQNKNIKKTLSYLYSEK